MWREILGAIFCFWLAMGGPWACQSPTVQHIEQTVEAIEPLLKPIVMEVTRALLREYPWMTSAVIVFAQAGQQSVAHGQITVAGLQAVVQTEVAKLVLTVPEKMAIMKLTVTVEDIAQNVIHQRTLGATFAAPDFFGWILQATLAQ